MSVNDVYLLATFIVLVALPLSLFIRKRSVAPDNPSASAPAPLVATPSPKA